MFLFAFLYVFLAGRYSEIYDQLATEELLTPPYDYNINRNWTSRTKTNLLGQVIYSQTAMVGGQKKTYNENVLIFLAVKAVKEEDSELSEFFANEDSR